MLNTSETHVVVGFLSKDYFIVLRTIFTPKSAYMAMVLLLCIFQQLQTS